ncbi:DNA topoisomerase I [Marinomonas sp. IMCC 4694]|uniref:DNA topoisomerase I n=1 Tax=Marinomonas sp. IMCC 4694 TaxID=2605432 RepID=UPI0011E7157A|nr:DNA topoisomerase I [Marinomonas sp. IMCC 4694]TYL47726.1 DNA topoisomerase I [Marinomonas sp. IMCC 4694]
MATLQILTIAFLIIIVLLSVVVGSRAHQKEKEYTQRRVKQLQLSNRADRVEQHIRGLRDINTDTIATDVLYDFYLDTLRELLQYSDDPEKIEIRITTAEEGRNIEPHTFNPEPDTFSFQEKTNYKERLTKLAKMLLYLRRKGRISNTHYQACYEYLRWLNLWIQLNRQMVQANKNFQGGDLRVAQTLYGVILSHIKSDALERPEKKILKDFVANRMKQILSPSIAAIQDSDNPEEALTELIQNLDLKKGSQ